jgi:hypothetical protein
MSEGVETRTAAAQAASNPIRTDGAVREEVPTPMIDSINGAVGIVPAATGTVVMAQVQWYRHWTPSALDDFPTTRWSGVETRS